MYLNYRAEKNKTIALLQIIIYQDILHVNFCFLFMFFFYFFFIFWHVALSSHG
ncbi:uncharacterized protein RNJ42_04484 [Nakaseomyces bracarensis]|uniref:uncharacterized protein n=1 Tax=Nakaseomyces bracarensis TaxID=273131 RepID=UPI003872679E